MSDWHAFLEQLVASVDRLCDVQLCSVLLDLRENAFVLAFIVVLRVLFLEVDLCLLHLFLLLNLGAIVQDFEGLSGGRSTVELGSKPLPDSVSLIGKL